jgi:uncharacterized protein
MVRGRLGEADADATIAADPRIGRLVNNAGIGATASLLDADGEKMDAMIRPNVGTLTRLTHAAVPGLFARGSGATVNIASIAAISPEPLNGVCGGTRALAFTQSLQHELADRGIRVHAVLRGAIGSTFVVIADDGTENRGWSGLPALEYRKQPPKRPAGRRRTLVGVL